VRTHGAADSGCTTSPTCSVRNWTLLPLRLLLPDRHAERLGLKSLRQERIEAVLPFVTGRLLDIGAGDNELVRRYGDGVGVDVVDYGCGALIVEDSSDLPFRDGEFGTVSLVAALNHIPHRDRTLAEAYRVLSYGGTLAVTMINPFIGFFCHKIRWFPGDTRRDWHPGERYGLRSREIKALCQAAGFAPVRRRRFLAGMNSVFVFEKPVSCDPVPRGAK